MLWLWHFFLEKRQFSYLLLAILLIAGTGALIQIPKENTPSIVIPSGFIITTLPGASASDMETLVTDKLENQISGVANIDTLTSRSADGVSQITAQFTANADVNQSIQDLRDAVSKAVPDLPKDASTPQVLKINLSDQPVIVASISGDMPATAFSTLGKTLSDDLTNISGVSKVNVSGVPNQQVTIIVRKEALAQYGLSLAQVVGAVSASNVALPAGSISIDGVNYDVSFKGNITDLNQIEDITIGQQNGSPIYLRDIAQIANGLAPATTYSRLSIAGAPSQQAIALTVYRQSGASIAGTANAVREKLDSLKSTTLKGLEVFIPPATDQGAQIAKQLGDLTKTGFITVALVVLVLFLTIGWRESLIAAISIPISFLIAFLGLYLTGNTLNFISLFALILAVGILVDSGIVVTEAIHARTKIYKTPLEAVYASLSDYAWPLIAGTMATVAVFIPLFFIRGIVGKFIAGIPYTLIFVLIASIFVALGVVPLIALLFTQKKQDRLALLQDKYTSRITAWYKRFLHRLLENTRAQKWFIWGLGALFMLSLLLPISGFVKTVFFPQSNQDFVFVNIKTPVGTTLARTDFVAREIEELLYVDPDISSFQTTVGQSSSLSGRGGMGQRSISNSNQANITVNLPIDRTKTSTEVVSDLESRLSVVKDAQVQVLQASNGPPSGPPIQIRFEGDNLNTIIAAADRGREMLSSIPNVINITSSTQNNGTQFDLTINRAKAAMVGVTTAQVAQTLRVAVHGVTATTITVPGKDIDVVVKLNLNTAYSDPSNTTQTTIDSIKNLTVPGIKGPVLLGSILSESLGQANASIAHYNKVREETVSAYPDSKTTTTAVVAKFQKRIGELNLPSSVTVAYGGEAQDISQSFTDMFVALIAGLVFMFMILIISFNSFRHTLHLLVIVPLSLIGVLDGLALTGQPVSFSALLGVIALGGVIINHAIILMDSMIRHLHAEPQKPLVDIVVDSAATRLRPIVLTTIATVIGMIPLSLTNATTSLLDYVWTYFCHYPHSRTCAGPLLSFTISR